MFVLRLYRVTLYFLLCLLMSFSLAHAEPIKQQQFAQPVESLLATQSGYSVKPIDSERKVTFEAHTSGHYHIGLVHEDWQFVPWVALYDRAYITHDDVQGKVLQIAYPQDAVGPKQGGGQFEVLLQPANAYWLSYKVKFDPHFDFRLGGKLPGLTSGGETFTGGNKPSEGEGWSARFMWTREGRAVVYLYYVDMKGEWGDGLPLGDFKFIPGRWYQLTQYIELNQESKPNGRLVIWVDDDKLLERDDLRFRLADKGPIDVMYFSTFHGGATPDWAPLRDSFAWFDDFVVSQQPLRPEFQE